MKRKLFFRILIFFIVAAFGFSLLDSVSDRTFTTQGITEDCDIANDDYFDVGIIGDSWVAAKKIDIGLNNKLSSVGNIRVSSCGQGGAKSKQIYENLHLSGEEKYSSNSILNGEFDLVVVVAGVNDIASRIGKDFYSFHIDKIVDQLNKCDILPVILTIPEFGIEEFFSTRPIHMKLPKDMPNKLLFDEKLVNTRENYKKALKKTYDWYFEYFKRLKNF